jgi:hypothetical protein
MMSRRRKKKQQKNIKPRLKLPFHALKSPQLQEKTEYILLITFTVNNRFLNLYEQKTGKGILTRSLRKLVKLLNLPATSKRQKNTRFLLDLAINKFIDILKPLFDPFKIYNIILKVQGAHFRLKQIFHIFRQRKIFFTRFIDGTRIPFNGCKNKQEGRK